MQILEYPRRNPAKALLAAFFAFGLLVIGYQFFPGMKNLAFGMHGAMPGTPAGVYAVDIAGETVKLSGWAPAHAVVRLGTAGKDHMPVSVDDGGRWNLMIPVDWKNKSIQKFKMNMQEEGGQPNSLGQISVYAPGRPTDGAYVWQEEPSFDLLLTPDAEESELPYLAYVRFGEDDTFLFAGRASAGSFIQLYVDGELKAAAQVPSDGYWTMTSEIKNGKKLSLRFDDLGRGESVVGRVAYVLDPGDEKNSGYVIFHTDKDGKKETTLLWKPEMGAVMPPDDLIAGQVLPDMSDKAAR